MKTTKKLVAALAALMTVATASLFAQGKPYVGTFRNYIRGRLTISDNGTWTRNSDGYTERGTYIVDESSKKIVLKNDYNDEYLYYDHGMWIDKVVRDDYADTLISTSAQFKAEDAADIAGKTFANDEFTFAFASDGKLTFNATKKGVYFVDKGTKMIRAALGEDFDTTDLIFTYEVDKKGKVTLIWGDDMRLKEQGKVGGFLKKLTK